MPQPTGQERACQHTYITTVFVKYCLSRIRLTAYHLIIIFTGQKKNVTFNMAIKYVFWVWCKKPVQGISMKEVMTFLVELESWRGDKKMYS